jgi:hypothetical protein
VHALFEHRAWASGQARTLARRPGTLTPIRDPQPALDHRPERLGPALIAHQNQRSATGMIVTNLPVSQFRPVTPQARPGSSLPAKTTSAYPQMSALT